ncbi:cryptochrome/photolyase family protein [Robiginitalea aurantiaca]|uniref:Cryptochrome/photolyase family protein n=1 Tax=Robiginitalea aurantiaca TaxID=3056915 RepID=A0ABT7WHJ4_9FLAO|nr:cryptochrome/photolyase family protein [Robiginitalea aurantiaca]MDM9632333.1 cryptochrome/photolyase family protein [Robiginitalea aurantiaca]
MKTLRLILGDQLNPDHSWFKTVREDVVYLMAEMRQETDYAPHHIQKVVAFFAAMRHFANRRKAEGHKLLYYRLTDPDNPQTLPTLVKDAVEKEGCTRFEYQLPDEYRLDEQLKNLCQELDMPTGVSDSEHFYSTREELARHFEGKKQLVMESFYRMMRKKHGVLFDNGAPTGGSWNYDAQNRKKWNGTPPIPSIDISDQDIGTILKEIQESGINTIGALDAGSFQWTTTPEDARALLNTFCETLLPHFGDYQDAMHTEERFLFHSRLSFAMNCKLISPREVVETVEAYYHQHSDEIHISQAEGFIRQILGWREYMRGIYWKEMPGYAQTNALSNKNPLPNFYWTGKTKMNCLKHAIGQSLEDAYAHHIQRLMITGNFALLAQIDPDEVDQWYLGIYADAVEWVQLPNTRGMSQFADGGIVGTKPYVSSANYIRKMSNYCSSCFYKADQKTGDKACPFNALYWNFLDAKKEHLQTNPRMGMMYRLLEKKDASELKALRERAADIISSPDSY